jgi:hypothetical protein
MVYYFFYSVTALGFLLSILSMVLIFLGKSIPHSENKPQIIKFGWLEVKANSAIGILTASLITAVLPLCLLTYLLSIDKIPSESLAAEERCELLKGKYQLHFNYIFSEKDGTRLVARKGMWNADTCTTNYSRTQFHLRGQDSTDFDIEILNDGIYQLVATGIFNYPAEVSINKNGELISRTFDVATSSTKIIKHYPAIKKAQKLGLITEIDNIEEIIDEALKIRADKHISLVTNFCTPTFGKHGGRDTLAFICQDYTRVMVKNSN